MHANDISNNVNDKGRRTSTNEKRQSSDDSSDVPLLQSQRTSLQTDDDINSVKSNNTNRHTTPNKQNGRTSNVENIENNKSFDTLDAGIDGNHGHVHFNDKKSYENSHLPPLPPGVKPKLRESDDGGAEMLASASWTTTSFTEVPHALDELTEQHHPSRTSAEERGKVSLAPATRESLRKLPALPTIQPQASTADLQSILLKRGQQSTLARYLRPKVSDEGTQAGVSSWDWLTRLEQMLIHFFLLIFESSTDTSKLVMEMMPTDAGTQVEEIFQLLLKAEPEMYKDLGHLVTIAEKWLIHWRGDSEERQKALDFVKLYMKGVKDKNYYRLPIQVRLHKLGAFIGGLKIMGNGEQAEPMKYASYKVTPPVNQIRIGSPRVKPATHFSRVVANILCGRTCDDPLPTEDVYADLLGRKVFEKTLHGDGEFKAYTDHKYGKMYTRRDIFSKGPRPSRRSTVDGAGDVFDEDELKREDSDCIENRHCWVPKYTRSYVENLEGNGCEVLAMTNFERGVKLKAKMLNRDDGTIGNGVTGTTIGSDKNGSNANAKHAKSKKLYDWVRGPDGKVYRRTVGSYTELGVGRSLDNFVGRSHSHHGHGGQGLGQTHMSTARYEDKRGPGGLRDAKSKRFQRGKDGNGLKGVGYSGKTQSDTKLGGYSSKGGKSGPDSVVDNKSRKSKKGIGVDAFKMDTISMDGSGDSGNEGGRYNPLSGSDSEKKKGKGGVQGNQSGKLKGKKEDQKFGPDYRGPSHYKSKNQMGDPQNRDARNGDARNGDARNGDARNGYARNGDARNGNARNGDAQRQGQGKFAVFRDHQDSHAKKSEGDRHGHVVDIYNKKNYQNRGDPHSGFRRGRYPMNGEYEGEEGFSDIYSPNSDYSNYLDKDGDEFVDPRMLNINQCWEKASKLMNKPHKALIVPPPENLLLYLEKKYPKSRWPRGNPIATRNYPNGQVFVAQYPNGASRVYYPHGGLALDISAPSPVTSQVLVVRDPTDSIFFFDKALLAELNSSGKGAVFGEDGVVKAQYSALGGFKLDGLDKGHRWQWNKGGQRMILKLNKYMSLRLSDQNRIFLNFYGNRRGFLVNVASGREVNLMNPERKKVDPVMAELKYLIRPKSVQDNWDYTHGRFNATSTLGFVDKAKHYSSYFENETNDANGSMSARNLFAFNIDDDGYDYDYNYSYTPVINPIEIHV